jgi:aminoglycoside phosphotransferase (APT) family kinase protein
MKEPGPLLGAGRDCNIYSYGSGLVLRRARDGRSIAAEAQTMEFVRAQGYPVPAIHEVSDDGTSIVMERIEGRSMVDVLGRKPWAVPAQAKILADLHRRLHELDPPDFLGPAPVGRGDRILHLDLHPLNVMLSPNGAVVIDWPNAVIGDPVTDVALAYLLMAVADVPSRGLKAAVVRYGRTWLTNSFLSHVDRVQVEAHLPEVAAWKSHNQNMSAAEVAAMWRLVGVEPPPA